MKIVNYKLNQDEYISEAKTKKSIYLHHTAGGYRPDYTIAWWEKDNKKNEIRRVGTAFVIGGFGNNDNKFDGRIFRCFDERFWAYHLGLSQSRDGVNPEKGKELNIESIGIEICCYGSLEKINDKFYYITANGKEYEIPKNQVCVLEQPWRGSIYFQEYTNKQIDSCRKLIIYLSKKFNIPLPNINYTRDWFEINTNALEGKSGLWTHCNVRADKTDCYPSPKLIKMLNNLNYTSDHIDKSYSDEKLDITLNEATIEGKQDESNKVEEVSKDNQNSTDPFFDDFDDSFNQESNKSFYDKYDDSFFHDLDKFLLNKNDQSLFHKYNEYTKERL